MDVHCQAKDALVSQNSMDLIKNETWFLTMVEDIVTDNQPERTILKRNALTHALYILNTRSTTGNEREFGTEELL
jgi:hypothetical protein